MIASLSYSNVARRIFQLTSNVFRQFFHHFAKNSVDGIIGRSQSVINTWRGKHAFQNSKQCQLKHSDTQALFPVKRKRFTGSMKENNPTIASKAMKVELPSQLKSTTLREAGEAAKSLYDQVNPVFEKITGHSLVKALTKVKDLNIEEKKSKSEKKQTCMESLRPNPILTHLGAMHPDSVNVMPYDYNT